MKVKSIVLLAVLFTAVGCKKAQSPVGPVLSVATLPMKNLLLEDLSDFSNPTANWKLAALVWSDYTKENDLWWKQGKGVLVNQQEESANENLITSWDHGDLELELEFMMPKGSNSGIYLQGRYEIQLLDSWKVERPEHSDCGGIYQRWDPTAPDGAQGYQGHAPAINACKAPGLWQRLYIKFTAPKFDVSGQKISNARFDKVALNGVVIHEDVTLTGPTRAAIADNEVSKGPLMIQGDHGSVAFRNISYKRYFDQKLLLNEMTYHYYEFDMTSFLPGFDSLQPVTSGSIDSFAIDPVAQREDFFGIRFNGEISVPIDGDYMFHTISDDGSKLYIDQQLVVNNDFNHGMEKQSGLIPLESGIHDIQVDYYNNQWGRGLAIFFEGPEMAYQPLHSVYREPTGGITEPLVIELKQAPELVRGFINYRDQKRTHVISVGDPAGVHYSFDLRTGTLLKCWRGNFADVSMMWRDRGEPQLLVPEAMAVDMPDGSIMAVLSQKTTPFPEGLAPGLRSEGYSLNNLQRPVFQYSIQHATANDAYFPSQDRERLIREVNFEPNGVENLYSRLAIADYIELLDNGLYSIGGQYYLDLLSENLNPILRKSENNTELLLEINTPIELKYSLLW